MGMEGSPSVLPPAAGAGMIVIMGLLSPGVTKYHRDKNKHRPKMHFGNHLNSCKALHYRKTLAGNDLIL